MTQTLYEAVEQHITNNGIAPITSIDDIQIGDELFFYPGSGYGGHGAYITVTKINRRSFRGIERKGSYKSGREWRLHKGTSFAYQWMGEDGCKKSKWFNQ